MTTTPVDAALAAGIDGIAVKPTECDLPAATERSPDTLVVDYEGAEYVPEPATLGALDDEYGNSA